MGSLTLTQRVVRVKMTSSAQGIADPYELRWDGMARQATLKAVHGPAHSALAA
jgi:hypothetical protein